MHLLAEFNRSIDQWMTFLKAYSYEMLCKKPDEKSWSLGQVYMHLINDTNYYVQQMKAALSHNENSEKAMHQTAKEMFGNNQFPDMLLMNPFADSIMQPRNKEDLFEKLLLIKEQVNTLFANENAKDAKGKTEHPGFYFFSATEWLHFSEMHFRHHLKQKKRIDDFLFEKSNGSV